MQLASLSFESLGDAAWGLVVALAGIWLVVATPQALHFVDKAYADKARNNPVAAAKQVKTFRLFGVFFALVGVSLVAIQLLGHKR